MSRFGGDFNACACMGPQGGDQYCPCRMQREGMDGYYNCNGDKEALAARIAEDQARLTRALDKMFGTRNKEKGCE